MDLDSVALASPELSGPMGAIDQFGWALMLRSKNSQDREAAKKRDSYIQDASAEA